MAVTSNSNATQSYQQQQQHHHHHPQLPHSAVAGRNPMDATAMPTVLNGDTQHHALKHDPGIAIDWSIEEQTTLEEGLSRYDSESPINKYIKIAALLSEKTVRDVALRCRWMLKKDNEKRRKGEEQNPPKKSKDKKDKPVDSKPLVAPALRAATAAYAAPMLPLDADDGIPIEAIGGTAGQLLEQNIQLIGQIKANFAACKLQENTDLLARFRDNLSAILNSIKDMPGITNPMPPLPVMMSVELSEALLPKSSSQLRS